jgi:hypothetical protein
MQIFAHSLRKADEAVIAEQAEPETALRLMTGGREVVEDYVHTRHARHSLSKSSALSESFKLCGR